MEIIFNGAVINCPQDTTVLTLLTEKELHNKTGIAVAHNQSVLPKAEWSQKILSEKDQLMIITATAGG